MNFIYFTKKINIFISILFFIGCAINENVIEQIQKRKCNTNSDCEIGFCANYHCTLEEREIPDTDFQTSDTPDIPQEICGDGILSDREECEENQFRDKTCESVGFLYGNLLCNQCKINTFFCSSCGNAQRDLDEECDQQDFGDLTCGSFGLSGPQHLLSCDEDCQVNIERCINNKDGIPSEEVPNHFSFVKHGTFSMGSPSDVLQPQRSEDETLHRVKITRDFIIQKHETTQLQWKNIYFATPRPSSFYECGDDCPVETITFIEVLDYLNKISEREGLEPCYENIPITLNFEDEKRVVFKGLDCTGYRLPTEAEWEYAAKGGHVGSERENFPYYDSEGGVNNEYYGYCKDLFLNPLAWYFNNSANCQEAARCRDEACGEFTCFCPEEAGQFCDEENIIPITRDCLSPHPVMQKEPNLLDLYDMHGNVSEMVWDIYDEYKIISEFEYAVDPIAENSDLLNQKRVIRGGNFTNASAHCRASARKYILWPYEIFHTGFRPVRTFP